MSPEDFERSLPNLCDVVAIHKDEVILTNGEHLPSALAEMKNSMREGYSVIDYSNRYEAELDEVVSFAQKNEVCESDLSERTEELSSDQDTDIYA